MPHMISKRKRTRGQKAGKDKKAEKDVFKIHGVLKILGNLHQ